MPNLLVRTGRRLEDSRDRALHVVLNRRAWTILGLELRKRLRRRWRDLLARMTRPARRS